MTSNNETAQANSSTIVRSKRFARAIAAQINWAGSAVEISRIDRGRWLIETNAPDELLYAVCRRHSSRALLSWESTGADGLVYFRSPWHQATGRSD